MRRCVYLFHVHIGHTLVTIQTVPSIHVSGLVFCPSFRLDVYTCLGTVVCTYRYVRVYVCVRQYPCECPLVRNESRVS